MRALNWASTADGHNVLAATCFCQADSKVVVRKWVSWDLRSMYSVICASQLLECSLLGLLALRQLFRERARLFALNFSIAVYKPKTHTNSRPQFYNRLFHQRRGIFLCKYDHFSQQYVHMAGFFVSLLYANTMRLQCLGVGNDCFTYIRLVRVGNNKSGREKSRVPAVAVVKYFWVWKPSCFRNGPSKQMAGEKYKGI